MQTVPQTKVTGYSHADFSGRLTQYLTNSNFDVNDSKIVSKARSLLKYISKDYDITPDSPLSHPLESAIKSISEKSTNHGDIINIYTTCVLLIIQRANEKTTNRNINIKLRYLAYRATKIKELSQEERDYLQSHVYALDSYISSEIFRNEFSTEINRLSSVKSEIIKISDDNLQSISQLHKDISEATSLHDAIINDKAYLNYKHLSVSFEKQKKETVKTKTKLSWTLIGIAFLILAIPTLRLTAIYKSPSGAFTTQSTTDNSPQALPTKADTTNSTSRTAEVQPQATPIETFTEKSNYALTSTLSSNAKYIVEALLILSIEIILIYFFRICLIYYNKTGNETLQLETRIALCGFMPAYAEHTANKSDKEIERYRIFEEHILSKIDSQQISIPTALECSLPIKFAPNKD